MAKPPPVERFRVTTLTTKEGLGATVAALTNLGHTEISFDLVTDVIKKRDDRETTSAEFLAAWVKDNPTFRAKQAIDHFLSDGRSGGAGYTGLRELVTNGILKRTGPGTYSRADVKALAAPPKTKRTVNPTKHFDKRGEDVILSYARRNHGRFNTLKLAELFAKEGRARNSLYASIDGLIKEKKVKRVGDKGSGQYVLLANATPKKKEKEPPAKTNGNGAAPVEVTDNG